ncbi:isoaspartyl peptidase/L-asparaginase family protein [Lichenicoccus sp.]|uniref:isoaspartyl peptidase/L-asparaginase family protein n=1 Tax=Lichenicoccus sp. TaxID=2781899 RepID=UPI003D11A1E6
MSAAPERPIAVALHGGCGVMARGDLPEADWTEAQETMQAALRRGWSLLAEGAAALDAVEAVVVLLEDSPHFNAGHGAALNRDGVHELDAAIMDGGTGAAGAVCAARAIRNPVRAARAVMHRGEALLLAGPAADRFAASAGLELAPQTYFTTRRRVTALQAMQAHRTAGTQAGASENEKHGTVGAVALDRNGHLAAATSTGGYTDKPDGRVGDSPLIGAGTYARDGVCAVSCTGQGEFFIRHVAAYGIAARMQHLGEPVDVAARHMIETELAPHRIGAGLVALDAKGRVSAPFNTQGMFRGWITCDGSMFTATHR